MAHLRATLSAHVRWAIARTTAKVLEDWRAVAAAAQSERLLLTRRSARRRVQLAREVYVVEVPTRPFGTDNRSCFARP